jgi:hypothetical protein
VEDQGFRLQFILNYLVFVFLLRWAGIDLILVDLSVDGFEQFG